VEATYGARGNVIQLGSGNRGQSNDGGDGEALHIDDDCLGY
jgi:hypothetical protein